MNTPKDTGRVEAFSDGVFAIAITLLVLDIKVPQVQDLTSHKHLWTVLVEQWPMYLAYVTSFMTILIMWMNHHRLFQQIQRTDTTLLVFNGLLLMGVTLVPFPTAIIAEFIRHQDAKTAAAIYSGCFLWIAITFNLVWRYAAYDQRLLTENHDPSRVQKITQQYRFGPVLYMIAFGLSFINVDVSVGMCSLLAVFFVLPGVTIGSRQRKVQ